MPESLWLPGTLGNGAELVRGLLMKFAGEPDVGNLLVRFDEGWGDGQWCPSLGYSIASNKFILKRRGRRVTQSGH